MTPQTQAHTQEKKVNNEISFDQIQERENYDDSSQEEKIVNAKNY